MLDIKAKYLYILEKTVVYWKKNSQIKSEGGKKGGEGGRDRDRDTDRETDRVKRERVSRCKTVEIALAELKQSYKSKGETMAFFKKMEMALNFDRL